jgi:hypothetical protein
MRKFREYKSYSTDRNPVAPGLSPSVGLKVLIRHLLRSPIRVPVRDALILGIASPLGPFPSTRCFRRLRVFPSLDDR